MNIIEVERLIRRIGGTLRGEGDPSVERKLAEEFSAVCGTVTLRLEQCRTMIEAGAAAQAIQLAETPPNLLDLVTLLEFRQADEWRQYCRGKGLGCPDQLSPQAVAALNDCYARGITPQHPAYAVYREAVFAKNDEAAVKALRSIVRLNPADANAMAELDRLDARILAQRLARLEPLLAADEAAAIREMDSIEAFGFRTKLTGSVWQRGQTLRCGQLLAGAEKLMIEGRLAELITQLDLLAEAKTKYAPDWPEEWAERAGTLHDWARAESAARQREEEFQGLISQLRQTLVAGEQRQSGGNTATLAEMRAELAALRELDTRVQGFSRPLPDGLRERFHEHSGLLRGKIARQTRVRQVLVVSGVTAAVVVLGVMALAYAGLQRANGLTARLTQERAAHHVNALKPLLDEGAGALIIRTPQLKAAMLAATEEINRDRGPLSEFETAFGQLPEKMDGPATIERLLSVRQAYVAAQQVQQSLLGDMQQTAQARLEDFHTRWTAHCARILPAINQELEARLDAQEADAAKFAETAELSDFRAGLAAAMPKADELAQTMADLAFSAPPDEGLQARCKALQEKFKAEKDALTKLGDATDRLAEARDLAGCVAAVADLAASPIQQSLYRQRAAQARLVCALREDPDGIARPLLTGTNSFLWEALKSAQSIGLIPAKVSPEGRQLFSRLSQDGIVNGEYHLYHLYSADDPSKFVDRITTKMIEPREGEWTSASGWQVYSYGSCEFSNLDFFSRNGRLQTVAGGPFWNYSHTSLDRQTAAWKASGFADLIDTENSTFTGAPLKVADWLCADTNSSPLLRAFLLQKLVAIMEFQPGESGLAFSPELRELNEKIQIPGLEPLVSGDWFVPRQQDAWTDRLDHLFASRKGKSFARPVAEIFNAVSEAFRQNFVYAGFVDPDGQPKWNTQPAHGLVFGFPMGAEDPDLLYAARDGDIKTVKPPLPLTPLLLFEGDLPGLLKQAGVQPNDPSFKGLLPPLLSVGAGPP